MLQNYDCLSLYIRAGCGINNNTNMSWSGCNLTTSQLIGVYGGLTGVVILLSIARTTLFFVLILRSSRLFHNKMFAAVLRVPVLFFDTNPVGRFNIVSCDTKGVHVHYRSCSESVLKGCWIY